MTFDEYLENLRKETEKMELQVPNDHKPTEGELNNICYLSMRYLLNWTMRVVDYEIIRMMSGEVNTLEEIDTKLIPPLAQYTWDHLMGEPDEPSQEQVEEACKQFKIMLYSTDEKTRNDTNARR